MLLMAQKSGASLRGTGFESSPAVVGGVVYVGSDDKNVYALDAANGAKIWSFTTGTGLYRLLLLLAA